MFVKYNGVLRGLQSTSPFLRNAMIQLCCAKDVFNKYIGTVPLDKLFLPADGTLSFDEAKKQLNKYTARAPARSEPNPARRATELAEPCAPQVHDDSARGQLGHHQVGQADRRDQGLPRHRRHEAARRLLGAQPVWRARRRRVRPHVDDARPQRGDGLRRGRQGCGQDGHRHRVPAG
jgi:hypothetical protein